MLSLNLDLKITFSLQQVVSVSIVPLEEIEENGSLSFLDITITHENNKFVISVYRKPTWY